MTNPYQPPPVASAAQQGVVATLPRTIQLSGVLRGKDVIATQWILLRKRWWYILLLLVMYVSFVLALGSLSTSPTLFGNTFLLLGLVVGPGVLPLTLLLVLLRLRGDARREQGLFAPTQSTLTCEGIQGNVDGRDVTLPWDGFDSYRRSSRVVLLFLKGSANHLIVARSKLHRPEDWTLLTEFLQERFPQ